MIALNPEHVCQLKFKTILPLMKNKSLELKKKDSQNEIILKE
jgi:hypothetical protein